MSIRIPFVEKKTRHVHDKKKIREHDSNVQTTKHRTPTLEQHKRHQKGKRGTTQVPVSHYYHP